jgi:hypothetical protein
VAGLTEATGFIIKGVHFHDLDYVMIESTKNRNEMKMGSVKYDANPRSIVTTVFRSKAADNFRATGEESALYRMPKRKKELFNTIIVESIPELNIGAYLCQTHRDGPFYRYGPSKYKNLEVYLDFVIFYSMTLMNDLKNERL